jgi:hypothetical protein
VFDGLLSKGLSKVGYVPAPELAAKVTALREMTIARDEIARRNAEARELLADIQARYDNIVAEYEADIQKWNGKEAELRQLRNERDILAEQIESANELIRELQSVRPQMRLMRPNSETRGIDDGDEAAPAEDEILVAEHTVEMLARVIVISLEGRTHWTLSVSDHQFKVAVHDRAYLDNPDHRFAKGSVIRGEFLETTFRRVGDGEPYTIRSLERVIEVIQPTPQITEPLFDSAAIAASERS